MNTQIRRRLGIVAGAVVVGSVVLTGCGGGDGAADEPAATETKDEAAEPAKDASPDNADKDSAPAKDDAVTAKDDAVTAWATTAGDYQEGTTFDFTCPPGGSVEWVIWGGTDGIYTEDSSICVAAVHAGLITAEEGGTVQAERTAGQETYGDGFEANGVTSLPWTVPWSGSFVFTKD